MLLCTWLSQASRLLVRKEEIKQMSAIAVETAHVCGKQAWIFQVSEDLCAVAILCGELQTKGLARLVVLRPQVPWKPSQVSSAQNSPLVQFPRVHLSVSTSETWKHKLASHKATQPRVLDPGHCHSLSFQLISSSLALALEK